VGGPAGLEKKRKRKLISRFRKMNKEIQVIEIIGKISKFPENCRKFGNARMWTWVNFGAQEFGKDFLGFQGSENKKIQEDFEVHST
jgi:hypothetical protein